jgi:hypothetical protein
MNGAAAGTPAEGDWPKASGGDEAAWTAEKAALVAAHQALVADLARLTDEQLFEPIKDPRNRRTGTGVTTYVLLHGLVQHHAYHSGQIAILANLR